MNRNDPRIQERTDERHRLGTDAAARDHYVDQQLSAIWVVDDGDIVHVEQTDAVGAWVEFVADDCGWLDCHYSDQSLAAHLLNALTQEVA
jgi:hypothetical protein